jgi:hypothetical protein
VRRLAVILASFSLTGVMATGFFPASRDGVAAARELTGDADRLMRAGLFDRAERAYREALSQDAASGPAHAGLARALWARRDLDWALAEAELAASLGAGPGFLLTLADLREQAGDNGAAIDALTRCLALLPDVPTPLAEHARWRLAVLRSAGARPLRAIDGQRVARIPFDIVQNKILFKASVNGGIPTDFILDTGAEHVVWSEQVAPRAGLHRGGGTSAAGGPAMTLIETLDVGGVTIRRVPGFRRPYPLHVLPNRSGSALSPLSLGLSMVVDYPNRELTIGRRLPHEPADVEIPLHMPGLPIVAVTSGGEPISMLVDTGSEATAVSPSVLGRLTTTPDARRIPMRVLDVWSRPQPDAFLLTPGIDLTIGAIALEDHPVIVRTWADVAAMRDLEIGGVLGHNLLRRYRVSFDLTRRVLRLRQPRNDVG